MHPGSGMSLLMNFDTAMWSIVFQLQESKKNDSMLAGVPSSSEAVSK